MARPTSPKLDNIDELFAQAEHEQTHMDPEHIEPKKRGRKPGTTNKRPVLSKDALESLITTANFGAVMMGQGDYALQPAEIEQLTAAWYDVLCLYPKVANMLLTGNTWMVWGSAITITYMVASKRIEYYNMKTNATKNQNPPGPTLDHYRNERNGKDDASEASDVYSAVSNSFGLET